MAKLARIRLAVAIVIHQQDSVFYARCPFLNVVTHADSSDKAFENIEAEIQFLLESALEDGSIIELLDHRTSLQAASSSPDDYVQLEVRTTEFDLPQDIPDYLLKRFADAPEISA